jgi:hypothetical protein
MRINYTIIVLAIFMLFGCNEHKEIFIENSDEWTEYGDADWKFNSDELIGTVDNDGFGFVMTKAKYDNFILELDFKPDSTINSGIFIRCSKFEINPFDCYEVNIWDLHPKQEFRTGAIVLKAEPIEKVETINQWNSYKIRAEKNNVKVWINDILTIDMIDDSLDTGYIGLQAAGSGEIKFKNIRVMPL